MLSNDSNDHVQRQTVILKHRPVVIFLQFLLDRPDVLFQFGLRPTSGIMDPFRHLVGLLGRGSARYTGVGKNRGTAVIGRVRL
jgi:hypothetical protein